MTDEHVAELGKRIDALAAEVAGLTLRIDRTLELLTNEGAALHQAQVKLETTVTDTARRFEGAQDTTDKMVEELDSKVRHLGDEVLEDRKERLASSVPPPVPPPAPPPARFPPPLPKGKGEP